jgi:hypothetical protein
MIYQDVTFLIESLKSDKCLREKSFNFLLKISPIISKTAISNFKTQAESLKTDFSNNLCLKACTV